MWLRVRSRIGRLPKVLPRRLRRRIDRRPRKEIVVDVSGACNLRCPSCPVGSLGAVSQAPGLIDVALFERLVDEADAEYQIKGVNLFNWGELMLHPRLPELVRIVKERGLACHLSTKLNVLRNVDARWRRRTWPSGEAFRPMRKGAAPHPADPRAPLTHRESRMRQRGGERRRRCSSARERP